MIIGQQVYYLLPRSPINGRPKDLYLVVRVHGFGQRKGFVVVKDSKQHHRILKESSLVEQAPAGAWIRE